MIMDYFLKGLLIGLVFGVPAGAIGALTIQRTLERGFFAGLITGSGSSAADLLYSCISVFGITMLSDFLTVHQAIIRVIGGFLILLLGIGILQKKELPATTQQDTKGTPVFYFLSSFTAAMLNPATILSFMVAFTAFGISGNLEVFQGVSLTAGILVGTLCWWATISGVVSYFRKRVTNNIYKWLNRILGCLMTLFSFVMIVQGIRQMQ